MKMRALVVAAGVAVGISATSVEAAQMIYNLYNHPDGSARPPLYGLRLDNLFDLRPGVNDKFTFDFNETAGTGMKLYYNDGATASLADDTIRISGRVYGGLDTGLTWGNPDYVGYWDVDFVYRANIGSPVDDAEVFAESVMNTGWIKPLFDVGGNASANGSFIGLRDKQGDNPYSFKYNNVDDFRLAGHDVPKGTFAGWGWLQWDAEGEFGDWLFTGDRMTDPVPEPGTFALFGLGLAGVLALRRRKKAQA